MEVCAVAHDSRIRLERAHVYAYMTAVVCYRTHIDGRCVREGTKVTSIPHITPSYFRDVCEVKLRRLYVTHVIISCRDILLLQGHTCECMIGGDIAVHRAHVGAW